MLGNSLEIFFKSVNKTVSLILLLENCDLSFKKEPFSFEFGTDVLHNCHMLKLSVGHLGLIVPNC